MNRHALATACLLAVLAADARGQPTQEPPAAAPAPAPCSAPEHRQFDFWAGNWEVVDPTGKVAGRNVIEPILGGCVLREHWKGARGLEGYSFNAWDANTRQWHQTWVDSAGTVLRLAGGLRDGAMVLAGEDPVTERAPQGTRHRITWTPRPDGTVSQHWESSQDGGTTWATAFDGTYRRADAAPDAG